MPARIVQLTDIHLTAAVGGTTRGQDVWANLRAVLDDVRARLEPIDLLVLTGDIANQRRVATYARLAELLQPWRGRLRVLPGNHDSRTMLRSAFADLWVPHRRTANFALTLAGWRLLGLDTARRPFVFGKLGHEQLEWLATELGASDVPTMLFLHHPPVCVGSWWLDKDLLRDRRQLGDIVARSSVRLMVSGHVHQECSATFAGVPVWTTPSTAYQFWPRSIWPARITPGAGYRVLELDGEHVTTSVVRLAPPARERAPGPA